MIDHRSLKSKKLKSKKFKTFEICIKMSLWRLRHFICENISLRNRGKIFPYKKCKMLKRDGQTEHRQTEHRQTE